MDNQKILDQAIILLAGLDLTDAESVQINNTKYDDGSSLVEVGVSYPATKESNALEPTEGSPAADILKEIMVERNKFRNHDKA